MSRKSAVLGKKLLMDLGVKHYYMLINRTRECEITQGEAVSVGSAVVSEGGLGETQGRQRERLTLRDQILQERCQQGEGPKRSGLHSVSWLRLSDATLEYAEFTVEGPSTLPHPTLNSGSWGKNWR